MGVRAHGFLLTVAATATITTAACLTEPANLLTGQRAGRPILLDARGTEVRLEFPCMKALLPSLRLDAGGHFEASARITWVSFAGLDSRAVLRVSGDVAGADMTLAVRYVSPSFTAAEPERYTLRLGAPADFSGIGCLA